MTSSAEMFKTTVSTTSTTSQKGPMSTTVAGSQEGSKGTKAPPAVGWVGAPNGEKGHGKSRWGTKVAATVLQTKFSGSQHNNWDSVAAV